MKIAANQSLTALPDVQSLSIDVSNMGMDWVGMEGIALPLDIAGKPLSAKVNAGIRVKAKSQSKGIHMSRLYLALDELTQGELTPQRIHTTLAAFLASQPDLAASASLHIASEIFISRPAMLSPQRGWKAYPLTIDAQLEQQLQLRLSLSVPYSSTCPSSAALSLQSAWQQFQLDFDQQENLTQQQVLDWLGTQGMPATPHSQRSWAIVTVSLKPTEMNFPVLELINQIENALGTPVQTVVKRQDEQAFALANGQNLMFCEDAARRLYVMLSKQCRYTAFSVRVEHQESLHAHNAVAVISREGTKHTA
ncbi:GTP cyclohydrolase FolE2 [Yersinia nurmii]|uniref:GTP cyclohydrolase FolE2 n=1 Tax=Yersinia nurmii TaxID=685706 RepID=A0AAW7JYM6_9GAMM|nr:GTP cyclohydrolase FolE2 [Yersinia nurmii]MDN0087348.1 GTP cyclohydrolase FolE2 [Yersinia nurmii]